MRLYMKFFSIHLKSQMQYKVSFLFLLLGQFLVAFSDYVGITFLFSRFSSVRGFSFTDILLCFSVVNIAYALAECFVRGFDRFSTVISNGEFDRIMLRPRNTIFLVLVSHMDFARLGKLVQGVIIMCIAIPASGVHWTLDKVLTYCLMILTGVAVFAGLYVIYASICFYTTEGLEFMNIFTDGGREFGQYPMKIYGEGVLKFFTFVVPLALFQYYPLLYILGRETSPLYALTPLFAFVFLIPCYILWRIGLRHYKSTGS